MESESMNESGGEVPAESPRVDESPVPNEIHFKKPTKKTIGPFFSSEEQESHSVEDSYPPSDSETPPRKTRDVDGRAEPAAASGSNSQEPVFFKKTIEKLNTSRFFTTVGDQPEESEAEVTSGIARDRQDSNPRAERSSKVYFSDNSQGNTNVFSSTLEPIGRSTIMADLAKATCLERQGKKKTSLFDKGGAAATALAAVASILGSAVLAALLTPSEVIFTHKGVDQYMYRYNYCYTPPGDPGEAYRDGVCDTLRSFYSFTLIITLIFDILCLISTIIVAIGMGTWLALAYTFFILSIISQTLAIIAAIWLAFPYSAAIGGSVLLSIFLIAAGFFVLPGIALAWHFKWGANKTLTLDQASMRRNSSTTMGEKKGPSKIERRVIEGTTVLHWAAYKGGWKHRLLLSVLLAAGEDVDAAAVGRGEGVTALMIAVLRGNTEVLKQLLRAGADVNRKETSNERSALHSAAQKGHLDCIDLLLKAGADTTAVDLLGYSPIQLARRENKTEACKMIGDFVQEKLNNELLHAAKHRKGERMRQLLAAGASPNSADIRGTTALIWTANRGFYDGVCELLNAKAEVNAANIQGSTALTEAALSGRAEVVKVLLDHNANHSWVVPSDHSTALHRAARRGIAEVVEELLTRVKVDKQAVDEAALNKNHAALRSLLNKAREGQYGVNHFQTAAAIGSDAAVRLYLEKGALQQDDKGEVTALLLAAQEGHADVVKTLVAEGGADTERCDARGKTPLHWAACEAYPNVVKELIKLGAKVDSVDHQGQTPLHAAATAEKEHLSLAVEVVEALLAGGASLSAVDKKGKRPLDLAKEKGNLKLLDCLDRSRLHATFARRTFAASRLPV